MTKLSRISFGLLAGAALALGLVSTQADARNPLRHRPYMMYGLQVPYAGKVNPLAATPQNIAAGGVLYRDHCVTCHGAAGLGNGEGGKELNPPPADIAFIMGRRVASDEFLFWTISEGGTPLKTDMPEFKKTLSEQERWQVILYLRAGFPPVKADK